ncbi:unnamed protein product [Rodentolepis nana]|uniref:J domain-containing protein n=1 Tax=Rodentolepis nana TaxID=102285 RepID=A0A0R3T0Z3_RODNA|nr:unnamed protein product [Rodentolepis nana]
MGCFARPRVLTLKDTFYRNISIFPKFGDSKTVEEKFTPKRSSRVYGCGVVVTGALGIKKYVEPEDKLDPKQKFNEPVPTHLKYFSVKGVDIKSVHCGFGYSVFIGSHPKLKNAFYGCGLNTDGQLGYQTSRLHGLLFNSINVDIVDEPQLIPMPYHEELMPMAASCGRAHSLVFSHFPIRRTSVLFSMGNNTFGQCAREIIENEIFTPENAQVIRVNLPKELRAIKQIECGQDHSLVLSDQGAVYACGLSTDGQTGLLTTDCVDRLTRVGGALKNLKVTQLSSRGDTVLALTECGRVFGWGNNEYNQIWPIIDEVQVLEPTELPVHECLEEIKDAGKIVQVAAAGSMCAILDEYGHVFVWGYGCLGLGPKVLQVQKPTLLPPALFSPALPSSDNQIVNVVPGLHHFVARSRGGLLWSWGAPRAGLACLGLGQNTSASIEESVKNMQTFPMPLSLPAEAVQVSCGSRTRLLPQLQLCCRSFARTTFEKDCYYSVLDIPVTATPEEIRAAYYTKCKSTHPDVASTDSQSFLEVNEAYSVLIDPEQRRLYDGKRGIAQFYAHREGENDNFQTPHFSCTPNGPKMSFNRASEIFHSRKFRRKHTTPGTIWREPKASPLRNEAEEKYEKEKHYYDYYNRRASGRPPIATLLLFILPPGILASLFISYES